MEKEVFSEIIYYKDYNDKNDFEKAVEKEMNKIKSKYADCIVTKEFYKGNNVLIRVCEIGQVQRKSKEPEEKQYLRDRADEFHVGGNGWEKTR